MVMVSVDILLTVTIENVVDRCDTSNDLSIWKWDHYFILFVGGHQVNRNNTEMKEEKKRIYNVVVFTSKSPKQSWGLLTGIVCSCKVVAVVLSVCVLFLYFIVISFREEDERQCWDILFCAGMLSSCWDRTRECKR